ncbi:MAG: THUMP-like domain-containing protein [Actinomycetes bacterium]
MDGDEVAAFRRLLSPEGQQLLASLPPYDASAALAVAEAARRAGHDDALVATALSQSRLRARAVPKFGDLAGALYFTSDGLEQATRPVVAARRAQRFGEAAVRRVADLCCGVGGDLAHLATAVPDGAFGVDRDALTCAVAAANMDVLGVGDRAAVRRAEAAAADLAGVDGVFVDPARRGARGRTFDPDAYSPPYSYVLGLAGRVPAVGAKLAPGIPHDVLPAGAEAEWVSVRGDVVECALWCGPLATGVPRRATVLPAGATVTGDGGVRAAAGPVGRYLWEPDGAVIRAGLVAEVAEQLDGQLLDTTIAYITGERPAETPFATGYEVLDVLPFGLKRLRTLLRDRGVGRLTIKKRGSPIEPETLRRQLRLSGPAEATIVVTRVAGEPTVLLVTPLAAGSAR